MPAKAVSPNAKRKIHVASDCSGIGTDILALESIPCLDRQVVHEFASEKDPKVRRVLTYNFPSIRHVYDDCTTRKNAQASRTDLYFNTSPCTTFSLMGKQAGPLPWPARLSILS